MINEAKKLAEAHWDYIGEFLRIHGEDKKNIEIIGWHYRTALIHGYKHGQESVIKELKEQPSECTIKTFLKEYTV